MFETLTHYKGEGQLDLTVTPRSNVDGASCW